MGDHTEVVRVVYNPERTSYEQLLHVFWTHHDPASQAWKRQYWNAIFYRNETQKNAAEASIDDLKKTINADVETKILPLRSFTRAETYHQKYYLQQRNELVSLLNERFPSTSDMLDSEVATRANAFIAGTINEKEFREHLDRPLNSSLPESALDRVKTMMCGAGK